MDSSNISALIIFISGIIGILLIIAIGNWLTARAKKNGRMLEEIILHSIGKPLIFLLILATIYNSLSASTLIPESFLWILDSKYLMVIITIIGTWIIWSFFRRVCNEYEEIILRSTSNEARIKLYHFVRSTFSYIIWILAGIYILHILEVDITPLLAAGGIAGIAAGIAGKEILGNFFSGALLAADQPFRVGDRIEVQDYIGDVMSIGPRATRIQTLDSQLVTIPNSILTNDIVVNHAEPEQDVKVRINIGVAYGSDIETVKRLLLSIANESIETGLCIRDPPPMVYFLEYAASSLNLQMVLWTKKYTMTLEIRDFINCGIQKAFEEHGIEIPFPQMDVHMRE